MNLQRTHVVLPQALIKEIDAVVGPRGGGAFLVETARAELTRRQLLDCCVVTSLRGGTRTTPNWLSAQPSGCAPCGSKANGPYPTQAAPPFAMMDDA